MENTSKGKIKIYTSFEGIQITIPSYINWFTRIFGIVWLIVWFVVFMFTLDFSILSSTRSGIDWPAIIIVTFLVLVGSFAMVLVAWGFFGKETLLIKKNQLHFNKMIFNLGIKRVLSVRKIKRIRFNEIKLKRTDKRNTWHYWGIGTGKIKFTYGMKTYSFGLGLDDAEANYLVEFLREELT